MRKALLLIAASFLCLQVSAQDTRRVHNGKAPARTAVHKQHTVTGALRNPFQVNNPTPAAVIFSEDFSGGSIPGTWQNIDNTPPGGTWAWSNTGPMNGDPGMDPAFSSAANGFVMFDSDGYGNDAVGENADLVTPSINCSANPTVFLSFNSYFIQYLVSAGSVLVSNDGGVNWNPVYMIDSNTVNPEFVVLDISTYAANQADVMVKWNYTGDYDYYWMLDDITVYEPAAADAGISGALAPASGCSLSSTEGVTVTIRNFGGADISGFPVTLVVDNGTPVTETVAATIAPNTTYDYTFTATADLSTTGTHNISIYTDLAADADHANDTISGTVENMATTSLATPYVMDFEPGEDLSTWGVLDNDGDATTWAIINTFPQSGTQCLRKAGSAVLDDDWVWTNCFDMAAGTNYSLNYWYRQFDLIAPCSLEVKLATAQTIAASTQLIATEVIDTNYHNSINTFQVPSNGTYYVAFHAFLPAGSPTAGSSSLRIDNIALSVVTGLNEQNNKGGVSIYPNPTSGLMTLNVKNFNNATVRVFNAIGKEIKHESLNSAYRALDLSDFANGIYIVKVEGEGFSYSEKVTLNK